MIYPLKTGDIMFSSHEVIGNRLQNHCLILWNPLESHVHQISNTEESNKIALQKQPVITPPKFDDPQKLRQEIQKKYKFDDFIFTNTEGNYLYGLGGTWLDVKPKIYALTYETYLYDTKTKILWNTETAMEAPITLSQKPSLYLLSDYTYARTSRSSHERYCNKSLDILAFPHLFMDKVEFTTALSQLNLPLATQTIALIIEYCSQHYSKTLVHISRNPASLYHRCVAPQPTSNISSTNKCTIQ
jgi:hypothetical protein